MFAGTENLCVLVNISVVDPHRFQCGSGSGIFGKCGSRSIVLMAKLLNFTDEKNPIF
jgi:hypothetical protein